MITRFEKIEDLRAQQDRGCKFTHSDVVEDVATAIVEQSKDNIVGYNSVRAVSRHLGVPYSTVLNVLRKMVRFYPFKIRYSQQLLLGEVTNLCIDTFWQELWWMRHGNGRFHRASTVDSKIIR